MRATQKLEEISLILKMYEHIHRRAWVVMEKMLAFSICDLIILICIFSSKKFSLKACMFTILFCSAFSPINCNKIISLAHKNLSNYIYFPPHTWNLNSITRRILSSFLFHINILMAMCTLLLCLSIYFCSKDKQHGK